MDYAAEQVRPIMTRIEKTMKLLTTNLALFKDRWGVEPGLIDRTKPKPGKLFEEDSEEGSEVKSEQIPGDIGKFFDFDIFSFTLL